MSPERKVEAVRALRGVAYFAFALVGAAVGGDMAGAGGVIVGLFVGELLALGLFALVRRGRPDARLQ